MAPLLVVKAVVFTLKILLDPRHLKPFLDSSLFVSSVLALPKWIFKTTFGKDFGEFTALRMLSSFLVWSHESIEGLGVSVSQLVQSEL